eukprot:9000490-Karenia_brevis.AAC.1
MAPFARLLESKRLMHEIGKKVRNQLLAEGGTTVVEDALLTSASRAVFHQNHQLAEVLWARHPRAGQFVMKNASGVLYLDNPEKFAHEIAQCRHAILSKEICHVQESSAKFK